MLYSPSLLSPSLALSFFFSALHSNLSTLFLFITPFFCLLSVSFASHHYHYCHFTLPAYFVLRSLIYSSSSKLMYFPYSFLTFCFFALNFSGFSPFSFVLPLPPITSHHVIFSFFSPFIFYSRDFYTTISTWKRNCATCELLP